MRIPKVAWTIMACAFIFTGLINIVTTVVDPAAFEGTYHPPSLPKGIFFLVIGLAYFVIRIVYYYRNKKKPNSPPS